ncbi:MAG: hypothetical protein AN483_19600 [Aphanizomenon flos-aquae MDT14a]|jgi:hypothetical protein|uniref:Uncharacterized protein n=1 Tax=Aphanizomenon flos-aquae WA102 TaxID=1710896 RepID=A0A1B7X0V4_APHFL|nr:MAG: hypothetical protein AN483_19600 [Aphanizomenon flos-aquae MDT14a]OBQ43014.1 MAG: hypothetical protein AN484_14685 [Aphanizomenon flos-aquae WA102]
MKNLDVLNQSENESLCFLSLGLVSSFSEKTNYYPIEFFKFAEKRMNCTIGWSCKGENGYACLSRAKKNCFSSLSQNHVTYIDWLKDQKNKNKAIVKPADKPEFKNNSKFPDNLDNLVVVKKLGGTTGAQLVKDPVTGKQYVMKNGSSPEHLENEAIADSAYQALGINVPNHKVYKDASGKPTKLAEYVEGRDLAEINKNGTQQEKDLIKSEIKKHFAADALLGNWDVVGLEKDNIMLGNDGKVYRIDNGGSLGYRAQGAKKDSKFWNKYPLDLWSMKDTKVNPDGAEYFGKLTHKEVVTQINDLVSKKDNLNGIFSKEDQEIIGSRLDEMKRVADISKTLDDDKWNDDYIGNFTRHTVGIRAAGITEKFPKEFKQKSKDFDSADFTKVVDENDKEFDNLRGSDSTMYDFQKYVNNDSGGGDYGILESWMAGQGNTSWGRYPRAAKYFMSKQRNVPPEDLYWKGKFSRAISENQYKAVSENQKKGHTKEIYNNTLTAYHAFTYEMLSKTDFPNKNKDGTITLLRTEGKNVTDIYNSKVGDDNSYIKRGSMESTSIFKEVYVASTTELTSQVVPIHRVFGAYFHEAIPGSGKTPFYGDKENEFVVMLEGIKSKHISSKA